MVVDIPSGYHTTTNSKISKQNSTVWKASFLVAEYRPQGPQTNVSLETVTNGGWRICHKGSYRYAYSDQKVENISNFDCRGPNIMMACGLELNSDVPKTLQVLAWAPREFVFQNTSNQGVVSAGTRFYRSRTALGLDGRPYPIPELFTCGREFNCQDWSVWGFAPESSKIRVGHPQPPGYTGTYITGQTSTVACDTIVEESNHKRMCWQTSADSFADSFAGWVWPGLRCGPLNSINDPGQSGKQEWKRIIFESD